MDLLVFGMMVLFNCLFFIAVAKFKKEEEQEELKGQKREDNKTFHTMSHVND